MSRLLQLEQVCHKITDGSHNPPKGVELSDYVMLSSKNILNGEITFEKPRFLKHEDFLAENKRTNIEIGDVLLTIVGTIGRCAVVDEIKQAFTLQRSVAVLKPNKDIILPKYLMFAMQNMTTKFERSARGVAQKGIYLKSLKQFEVVVPSLLEQQRIVDKLDAAFAQIDNLSSIENEKTFNSENIFNSYLSDIFTNSSSQYFDLENVCKITSSKRIMKADYVQSGIPFFRTKEIKQLANNHTVTTELFISEQQFIELDKKFGSPTEGDVLITAIGTIGEIYVVNKNDKFYFKDGNVLWLKELKNIVPQYLKYALRNFVQQLNEMAHGAAYSALPIQRLKTFKIPLPSIDEQHEISKKLEDIEIQNIKHCKILTEKAALTKKLKSAILAQELQSGAA